MKTFLIMCLPLWEWLIAVIALCIACWNWYKTIKVLEKLTERFQRWKGHPFYYTDERSIRRFKEGK